MNRFQKRSQQSTQILAEDSQLSSIRQISSSEKVVKKLTEISTSCRLAEKVILKFSTFYIFSFMTSPSLQEEKPRLRPRVGLPELVFNSPLDVSIVFCVKATTLNASELVPQ